MACLSLSSFAEEEKNIFEVLQKIFFTFAVKASELARSFGKTGQWKKRVWDFGRTNFWIIQDDLDFTNKV
jgi:hypothetical protein